MKTEKDQFQLYLEDEEVPETVKNMITDEQLKQQFAGTSYDPELYRYHVKHALLARASDRYICGSLQMILQNLGLIYKNLNLTGIGKSYLWNSFKSEDYE